MITPRLALRILPLCLLGLATPAQADLLVHEPYDYSAETQLPDADAPAQESPGVAVADGGTGMKGARRTPRDRSPLLIASEGLTYTDIGGKSLAVSGNAAKLPEGNSAIFLLEEMYPERFERLRHPDNPAMLGNPGQELWFSFLMRAEDIPQVTQMFTVKFSGGRSGFSIGMLNNDGATEPWIRIISVSTKRPMEEGHTYLVVGKLIFGEEGETEIWLDPELGTEHPTEPPSATIKGSDFSFKEIWFTKNSNDELGITVDEFRIGDTYQDVTPVSQP